MSDIPKPAKAISPSARTVTVCCKIPNGLQLQLQKQEKRYEDTRDGPIARPYFAKFGKVYHVHGPAYPTGTVPKGYPRPPEIVGGYALTHNIPVEFWEQWVEQNKLAPYVVAPDGAEHGMIFAYASHRDAVSACREYEELLSGMEPLSTDEDKNGKLIDSRLPRPQNMAVAKIAPEPRYQEA